MRGPDELWAKARGILGVLAWVTLAGIAFSVVAMLANRSIIESLRQGGDFEAKLKLLNALGLVRALVDLGVSTFVIIAFARLAIVPAPSVKGLGLGATITAGIAALFSFIDLINSALLLAGEREPLFSDRTGDLVWYASIVANVAVVVVGFLAALAVTRLFRRPQPVGSGVAAIVTYALFGFLPIYVYKIADRATFARKNPWALTLILAALLAAWGACWVLTLLRTRDAIPVRR